MQYVLQDQNDQILNEQHHLSNSLNRFFTETQIKMDLFYVQQFPPFYVE